MKKNRKYRFSSIAMFGAIVALLVAIQAKRGVAQGGALHVGASDIGGVVTSAKGPEAGVWVIAETTEPPTKLVKIVVTDDKGQYLIPELSRKKLF